MSGSTGIVVTPATAERSPAVAAASGLSNIASVVVEKNKKVTMASLSVPGQGQGQGDTNAKKSRRSLASVNVARAKATAATANSSGNKKKKKKGARKDEANFPIPLA